MTVTVPSGASSGKISVLINGNTFSSASDFTVLYPSIDSFSPSYGTEGSSVTITGTNFDPTASNNIVKFNGVLTTVQNASPTSLTVNVPSSATTGKISVLVNLSTVNSATDFTVLHPSIVGFSPTSGVAGDEVIITGQDFDASATGNNTVKFNGVTAVVSSVTSTQMIVNVPQNATSGTISVTIGTTTATSAGNFTLLVPTITSFYPSSGVFGTSVVITGTNFSTNSTYDFVSFNGTATTVINSTSTQLTVDVPLNATSGTISLTIGTATATSAGSFSVLQLIPTITSFSPTIGSAGIPVVIAGTNFSSNPAYNVVLFNGVAATVTSSTPTQITATAPAGATTGQISVNVGPNTGTSADPFQVCNAVELLLSNVNISSISGDRTRAYFVFDIENVGASVATLTNSNAAIQSYFSMDAIYDGADLPAGAWVIETNINSGQTYTPQYQYVGGTVSHVTVDNYPYLILRMNTNSSVGECDNTISHLVVKRMIP
jgi:hypothetical protein